MKIINRRDADAQRFLFVVRKIEHSVTKIVGKFRLCVYASLRLMIFVGLAACSIPNLESQACIDSRNTVREFYSLHFGNDMLFSAENLKRRERFLTPELARKVSNSSESIDPFTTGTSDIPKAFRVSECREISPTRTEFQVLLFWRTDERTEQREIKVEAEKDGDKWLIDKLVQSARFGLSATP